MNVLSLFAGIGGLELGLERAGMTVVGQVEIDPFCQRVLAKHWPEVPRHDDVRTAAEWWRGEPGRPRVDLVCGGFPCQPVSLAAGSQRRAQDDPRWLWPELERVIRALRPRYILLENTPGLLTAGFGDVLGDLASLGFDAQWSVLSACAVGAPHSRERVFILAHPASEGRPPWGILSSASPSRGALRVATRSAWWDAEPNVGRVAHGLSRRLADPILRMVGNAVVPQVTEYIGRLILAADKAVA